MGGKRGENQKKKTKMPDHSFAKESCSGRKARAKKIIARKDRGLKGLSDQGVPSH